MRTTEEMLAEHPFFRGLKPEYLQLITGCSSNIHFHAGQYLLREGEPADRFYTIRSGTVAVEVHVPGRGPVTIETVGANQMLGWSWLFPPYRGRFDGRAREEVHATVFDGACLRGKCEADPVMGYDFMKRLAHLVTERLAATRLQLVDMYGSPPGN